jgi:hypothetical protein
MSSLALALVISIGSAQTETGLRWVITAVIGGAMLTELLVQMTTRNHRDAAIEEPPPVRRIDELDEEEPR